MRIIFDRTRNSLVLSLILFVLTACSSTTLRRATASATARIAESSPTLAKQTTDGQPSFTQSPTTTIEPTEVSRPTSTTQPTDTPTSVPTNSPTVTPVPTVTPTYSILRGTILEQANCRYGPGAAYLYKYGVYPGYNMNIIGRNETGTWVVVQAIGGHNPCWVKASLIDIKGEVMSTAPTSLPLPESPYYGPLTGVWAERRGDSVIISWDPLILRAGDDSLQYPYLVEAWLCVEGHLKFEPIGSWETMVTVKDEAGCTGTSHARVYGVEKHGYTAWVTVPWPQR
jgi:hypothetical protein